LLILDEPTAGVDIELRRSMWDFLREINAAGTTIILTTHYLEEAESLCRNVAIIDHGTIVQNTSVRNLLQQLNKEIFIFDSRTMLEYVSVFKNYHLRIFDDNSFEVKIEKWQSLNHFFEHHSQLEISIFSILIKAYRPDVLFVSMVSNIKKAGE